MCAACFPKTTGFFPPTPIFSFFFFPPGTRRSAWKRIRTELQLQQQMAWVEVTCIFIYIYFFAANCTSFIWNIGHTFFGSSRWCLSRSISCENYVSKYGVTYVEDYLSTVILCTIKESLLCIYMWGETWSFVSLRKKDCRECTLYEPSSKIDCRGVSNIYRIVRELWRFR